MPLKEKIMKIEDILKNKQTISLEFFPPKTKKAEEKLTESIEELSKYNCDFISLTYGAGGSTREKTIEWVRYLKLEKQFIVMPHLTCIAHNKKEIHNILEEYQKIDIDNILALRGDLPKDSSQSISQDFQYASDMINYISQDVDFSIGGAAYSEKHPQAESLEKDIDALLIKQEKGAKFFITQLFFKNDNYFRFLELARKKGITVPIVPGILPITSYGQIDNFVAMCGAEFPDKYRKKLDAHKTDKQAVFDIGIDYAINQCNELLKQGAGGIHLYTVNNHKTVTRILDNIK